MATRLTMNGNAGRTLTLLAAGACLGLACAADPGDPLGKASNAAIGSSGSSGSDSSSSSSSGGASTGSSGIASSSGSGSSSGFTSASSGSSGGGSSASGSGSSSGTSGNADAAPDAPTGPSCVTTSTNSAAVSYFTEDMANATSVQTVRFDLQITNAGFSMLNLSDVTVRYWFTADGNPLPGTMFTSYYSSNGNMTITSEVHGTFVAAPPGNVTPTSDSYLELSFGTGAGMVGGAFSGGGAAKVQAVFFDPKYMFKFNETNDYSFDPTKTGQNYQPSKIVTAYVKGALVWGCEPGAPGAGTGGSDAGQPAVDAGPGG